MDTPAQRSRSGMAILALAAGALLAILVVFAVELTHIQNQSRRDAVNRFHQRAQIASALTEAVLASAASADTQAQNARRFGGAHVSAAAVRAYVDQGQLIFAAVVDARGRPVASFPRADSKLRRSILAPSGVVSAVMRGQPYAVSGVVSAPIGPHRLLELAEPIKSAAGRRVLISGLTLKSLGDFLHGYLARVLPTASTRAYVLDDAGAVVGAAGSAVAPGAPAGEPGLTSALDRGIVEGGLPAGRYLVAARVAHTPWRVVLTASDSRLFAAVSGANKWVPWLIFAAFAALGIVALALLQGVLASAAGRLRQANAELIEVNHRLERANHELAERAGELGRSNTELEQFASIASHDLQEPLRKVQTFSSQLVARETDRLSPQGQDYLRRMGAAAARMQALIEDLLTFSRVSTHGREFVAVDLDALAGEVLDDLEVAVREAGATVTIAPLPSIVADPLQMRQLLQNLLSNALKFRREDAPLEVRVSGRVDGDWVELKVADNGIGFEPQYAGRIFLVFERLHGAGTYPGTGIGLALCRKIVARHGGQIAAEGRPGAGATFTVRLPVREDQSAPLAAPQAPRKRKEGLVRV